MVFVDGRHGDVAFPLHRHSRFCLRRKTRGRLDPVHSLPQRLQILGNGMLMLYSHLEICPTTWIKQDRIQEQKEP